MKEELAGALGVIIFRPGELIGEDPGSYQIGFVAHDSGKAARKVGVAKAHSFDFGAEQVDASLEGFFDFVVIMCFAIYDLHKLMIQN